MHEAVQNALDVYYMWNKYVSKILPFFFDVHESNSSITLKHSGRHMALSRLVTLSISSLHTLDTEANTFYDRAHRLYDAALLTLNMLLSYI